MQISQLDEISYDLEAGISKIVDHLYESLDNFTQTIEFSKMDDYTQKHHLSIVKTEYLSAFSLSNEIENLVVKAFTKFQLFGLSLRKFSYSIRILSDLGMIAEHLYEAHLAISKINVSVIEFNSLKQLWVKELVHCIRHLLIHFVSIYHLRDVDVDIVRKKIEEIKNLELDINKIFNEHTSTIINMAGSSLIQLEDAFALTSSIRHFERIGDITYSMFEYALTFHEPEIGETLDFSKKW